MSPSSKPALIAHLDAHHPTLASRGSFSRKDLALAHETSHKAYPQTHDHTGDSNLQKGTAMYELPTLHPLAHVERSVEERQAHIDAGDPCPSCEVAWLGRVVAPGEYVGDGRTIRYELNHLPDCAHVRQLNVVCEAIAIVEEARAKSPYEFSCRRCGLHYDAPDGKCPNDCHKRA